MNRRDFLLLKTERSSRVAELLCERLYMHYQQLSLPTNRPAQGVAADVEALFDAEPPTVFAERSTHQLFSNVERELQSADVLRVVDREWLAVDEFGRDVEGLLAAFRRRGGRVEYRASSAGAPARDNLVLLLTNP